jgi:hypothetical protein
MYYPKTSYIHDENKLNNISKMSISDGMMGQLAQRLMNHWEIMDYWVIIL